MNLADLLDSLRVEFPKFKLVPKAESTFMRALYYVLMVLTLGAQSTFLTTYTTTIGYTIYVPTQWDGWSETKKLGILRHERVHLRQSRKWSIPLYSLLYVLVPLPIGLAYFRMKFEKEAYAESIRAAYEKVGSDAIKSPLYREAMISYFTTGAYGWMWPFPKSIGKWFDDIVAKLESGWTDEEIPTKPEGARPQDK